MGVVGVEVEVDADADEVGGWGAVAVFAHVAPGGWGNRPAMSIYNSGPHGP